MAFPRPYLAYSVWKTIKYKGHVLLITLSKKNEQRRESPHFTHQQTGMICWTAAVIQKLIYFIIPHHVYKVDKTEMKK